jgi:hypothetical protein
VQSVFDPLEQRERGLELLRDLTLACVLGAAGLLIAFSFIAAVSIPGQAAKDSAAATAQPLSASDDQGTPIQAPGPGSVTTGGGTPVVVSGGSR